MRTSTTISVRLLALAAAVLGVSSASAAAAASSPCKLASPVEVKAAFGGTVAAGRVDTTLPGVPTCHFAVKRSNLGIDGLAVVFLTPGQTPATFAVAKKVVPGAVSVGGVGNSAFYDPHTTAVEFLKGQTVANAQAIFLSLGGRPVNSATVKADVIKLAKAVAKHA
jgi:hypothetical protein